MAAKIIELLTDHQSKFLKEIHVMNQEQLDPQSYSTSATHPHDPNKPPPPPADADKEEEEKEKKEKEEPKKEPHK